MFLLPALLPGVQAANVDSLEQVLRTGKLPYKEWIELCRQISWEYRYSDPGKSMSYTLDALALARKEKNRDKEMLLLYDLGETYLREGKPDSALYLLEQSLSIAKKEAKERMEKRIYLYLGNVYKAKSMYSQALKYYMEAVAYFEKLGDDKPENKDNVYEKDVLGLLFVCIGEVYSEMNNTELCLQYYSKAEAVYRGIGNNSALALLIVGKATVLLDTRSETLRHDRAAMEELEASLKQALKVQQASNNRHAEIFTYSLLGNLYMVMGGYADAQASIDSAFRLVGEMPGLEPTSASEPHAVQSSLYYRQGKYAESEAAALKRLAALDSTRVPAIHNMMENLILSNIKMGNAGQAEKYFTEYWPKVEAYMKKEYQKGFSEMEVKYETEKKELRIAILEKEQALYIWLGVAAVAILLLALLAMFLWIMRMKKEKQLVAVQSVLDGETAERTRLSRDLHDGLGSTLSAVKFNLKEMRKHGAPLLPEDMHYFNDALSLLDDAIAELHRMAHNMMPGPLSRSGLKMSLADFCRSTPNVEFQYMGNGDRLDPKLEAMIYRTVHELVNNALRHASATHIFVQLIEEGGRLSLVVQDDGKGFDPKTVTPGLGLKNIRSRVAANNGHLEISSEIGHGTEISVEFKL